MPIEAWISKTWAAWVHLITGAYPAQISRAQQQVTPGASIASLPTSPVTEREAKPLPAKWRASTADRALGMLVLLISLGLLVLTQVIFSIAIWLHWDLQWLESLRPLACAWPGFCELRFPPYALIGFAVALLAGLLFGWWLHRLPIFPVLADWPRAPMTISSIQHLINLPNLLGLAAFLVCEGYIAAQVIQRQAVSPVAWLVGLGLLMGLVWQADRARGVSIKLPLRGLSYMAGLSTLLIALAAVSSGRFVLAGLSSAATVLLLLASLRGWSRWDWTQQLEWICLPAVTAGSFLLLSYGLRDWNWSWIGDEYAFYEAGCQIVNGRAEWLSLSGTSVFDQHPVFSSVWQAITMWLFGADSYGWRISNPLVVALSIPPFYYLTRQILGKAGGLMAAALYGCSHVLLSFGKIGYNHVQASGVLLMAWAALTWASQWNSLAGFALTGILLGVGFYTFGMARLFSLVIAWWLLLRGLPRSKANWIIWGTVIGAAVVTAIPIIGNRYIWETQLTHTFLNSEAAHTPSEMLRQILANSLYGLTSFLTNNQNTHFVFGAHADPLTGSLMILGIAGLLATLRQGWRVRLGLLGTWMMLVVITAGIQNHAYPATTWTFALVPMYALLAAAGLLFLYQAVIVTLGIAPSPIRRSAGIAIAVGIILAVIVPLNVWLSTDLSQRRLPKYAQPFVIQTAQMTADRNGAGPHIYFVIPRDYNTAWFDMMLQAYGIPRERVSVSYQIPTQRLALVPTQQALKSMDACQAAHEPAVLIMADLSTPEAIAIIQRMQSCWPGAEARLVYDALGNLALYRIVNQAARPFVHAVPGFWREEQPTSLELPPNVQPGIWRVSRPYGIAADTAGRVAAVEADSKTIVLFDADGHPQSVLSDLTDPTAVSFAPNGELVILDAGAKDGLLAWADESGHLMRRAAPAVEISEPRGLHAAADGTLYMADAGRGSILHLDENGQVLHQFQDARFPHPASVAVAADGRLAVADPIVGRVYILDTQGQIQTEYAVSTGDVIEFKPGLAFMPDGSLLLSDPQQGRIVRLGLDGQPIQEWSDLAQPTGLALGADNRLYALEAGSSRVTVLELTVDG